MSQIDFSVYGPFDKSQVSDALIRELETFSQEELNNGVTIAVTLQFNGCGLITYAVNSWDHGDLDELMDEIELSVETLAQPCQSDADELLQSVTTLEQLIEVLTQHEILGLDLIDWTELPTFGGDDPADTQGVWSWDKERILVGTCRDDLDIQDREVNQ